MKELAAVGLVMDSGWKSMDFIWMEYVLMEIWVPFAG